jgi:dTDP-glucose 4,6-dehydratase/UDP-glucose 4-epimerase
MIERWTEELAGVHPIDWSSVDGGRLLLTGCTGPFGLWILHRLSRACRTEGLDIAQTVVLTRQAARVQAWLDRLDRRCRIRVIESDVRGLNDLPLPSTHVIHGATTAAHETTAGASPLSKFDTVVDGTRALIRSQAHSTGARLLFLSSGIAYGNRSSEPLREDCDRAPQPIDISTAVGHAKRSAEFLLACHAQQTGSSLTSARCFSFSGPGIPLELHYAIGDFIRQALDSDEIVIRGDGTPIRAYLHMGDMALWVLSLLTRRSEPGSADLCNVGSDREFSLLELARRVAAVVNPRARIRVLSKPEANVSGNHINRYVPCLRKARDELGLKPWTVLEASIAQQAAFARHP